MKFSFLFQMHLKRKIYFSSSQCNIFHSTIFKHYIRVFDCCFLFIYFFFISAAFLLFPIIRCFFLLNNFLNYSNRYSFSFMESANITIYPPIRPQSKLFFPFLWIWHREKKKSKMATITDSVASKVFFLFNFLPLYIGSGNVVCKRECKMTYREYGTSTCKPIHRHDMHTNARTNIQPCECARVETNTHTRFGSLFFFALLPASLLALTRLLATPISSTTVNAAAAAALLCLSIFGWQIQNLVRWLCACPCFNVKIALKLSIIVIWWIYLINQLTEYSLWIVQFDRTHWFDENSIVEYVKYAANFILNQCDVNLIRSKSVYTHIYGFMTFWMSNTTCIYIVRSI